jgi:pimeloyl-ACP methyl ester carboxylesterase
MAPVHGDISEVSIAPSGLPGALTVPNDAKALVVFAHGSGSSRHSPRNITVADALNQRGFATLLFDLLTPGEEFERAHVFNIQLLSHRLSEAVRWADRQVSIAKPAIGLFGASTGAAAALVTAAELPECIGAVVSRGGRPDLAGDALERVRAPTLLIVGGSDGPVIELNEEALARLPGPKALRIVPGATHLFSEHGALETVIGHAQRWFEHYLVHARHDRPPVTLDG